MDDQSSPRRLNDLPVSHTEAAFERQLPAQSHRLLQQHRGLRVIQAGQLRYQLPGSSQKVNKKSLRNGVSGWSPA